MVVITYFENGKTHEKKTIDLPLPLTVKQRIDTYRSATGQFADDRGDTVYLLPSESRDVEKLKILNEFGYLLSDHNKFHINDMGTPEDVLKYFLNNWNKLAKRTERMNFLNLWYDYWDDFFFDYATKMREVLSNWIPGTGYGVKLSETEYVKPIEPTVYVYKVLSDPIPKGTDVAKKVGNVVWKRWLEGGGLIQYQKLDDALYRKNISDVLNVLREMVKLELSPAISLFVVFAITGVVSIIIEMIGTYNFAPFMMEEALQTIDMAIYSASKAKQWDLMDVALKKKEELMKTEWFEVLQAATPFVNVWAAQQKFFEASQIKLEVDKKLRQREMESSQVNPGVSLKDAESAIAKGEDPTKYLPSSSPKYCPVEFTGKVVGVVDGDTIDSTDEYGYKYRVRLIGIDAPEFATKEGKTSAKFLTDLIFDKTITVKVDSSNALDKYGRYLGVVFLNGVDVNKTMLSKGYAQYYFMGSSRYYSEEDYKAAYKAKGKIKIYSSPTYCKIYVEQQDTGKLTTETLELMEGTYTIGASKEGYKAVSQTVTIERDKTIEIKFELEKVEAVTPPTEKVPPKEKPPKEVKPTFKIYITSTPANAKLYIDGTYTHHRTPSNEGELSDVLGLLTPGSHKITLEKGGMRAEKIITTVDGDNGTHNLTLETVGLPRKEEPTVEKPPITIEPTVTAVFDELMRLTEGRAMITRKEVLELKKVFGVS